MGRGRFLSRQLKQMVTGRAAANPTCRSALARGKSFCVCQLRQAAILGVGRLSLPLASANGSRDNWCYPALAAFRFKFLAKARRGEEAVGSAS